MNTLASLKPSSERGFSFIEVVVSISVALVAFGLIYQFFSGARSHYMVGTVNLQNLQEARIAINYLRRDFSSACPKFEYVDSESYLAVQKVQKQIFTTANPAWDASTPGKLIDVSDEKLSFHRFRFDSDASRPAVDKVEYVFDRNSKKLRRFLENGRTIEFNGFESVQFKLYVHQLNPEIPVLWVKFTIHEGDKLFGSDKIGVPLELTTTINSSFISGNLKNLCWNYEIYHSN